MRWNTPDKWVWSADQVHEALVDTETFEHAQQVLAAHGAGRATRERHRVRHQYALRGLLHCGCCTRRMQGQWNHDEAYYRCRYPQEYALANTVEHPRNVYLAERDVLPALDNWLAQAFAPNRLAITIEQLFASQPERVADSDDGATAHTSRLRREAGSLPRGPRSRCRSRPGRSLDRRGPGPQSSSTSGPANEARTAPDDKR